MPIKITYSYDLVLENNIEKGTLIFKNDLKPESNIFNITNLQPTKLVDETEGAKRVKIKNSNKEVGFNGFWSYRTLYITEDCQLSFA